MNIKNRIVFVSRVATAVTLFSAVLFVSSAEAGKPEVLEMMQKKQAQMEAQSSKRTVLYWYDPMMPDQHFDKPGKSPYQHFGNHKTPFLSTQLVPKYADDDSVKSNPVTYGPRAQPQHNFKH